MGNLDQIFEPCRCSREGTKRISLSSFVAMKREREEEDGVEAIDRQAKRLKSVPLPADILALPHVVNRIDDFAVSYEEAAMKAAATGQIEWLETLLPKISNYDTIIQIGAAYGHCAVIEAAYVWGEFDYKFENPSCEALTNAIKGNNVDALQCLLPMYDCDLRDILYQAIRTDREAMIEMVAEAVCESSTDREKRRLSRQMIRQRVTIPTRELCFMPIRVVDHELGENES